MTMYSNLEKHQRSLTRLEARQEILQSEHDQLSQDSQILEQSTDTFEKARDIAHQSGLDRQLAQYYFVAGQYEIAIGNIPSGMQMVEDALDIFDKLGSSLVTQCLLVLTSAEIDLLPQSTKTETTDSGLWMLRLENHARKNNLTGILMQHAMLKAKLQRELGLVKQSRETLQGALEISDSSSVRTLRNQITDNIQQLARTPDD